MLDLTNPKEFEILQHMCEAYLNGALYRTDFIYLLIWESECKDIEDCLESYYERWNNKECQCGIERAAETLAHMLMSLQMKIVTYA